MNECTELTTVEQLQKEAEACGYDFSALWQAAGKIAEAFREAVEAVVPIINDAFSGLAAAFASVKFDTWLLAVIWAEDAHPEWLAIYYRTKKARIRKKYRDRIMREYVKEVTN